MTRLLNTNHLPKVSASDDGTWRRLIVIPFHQQTNARLWRQGQKSATVVIQHIITKGTVDERIMKALQDKDKTQTALMEAVKAEIAREEYA